MSCAIFHSTKRLLVTAASLLFLISLSNAAHSQGTSAIPGLWQGLFGGAQIGGAWGHGDRTPEGIRTLTTEPDGVLGGFHIGHNWQHESFVFGLVGDVNLADLKDTQLQAGFGGQLTERTDIEVTSSVRALVGLDLGQILLYVTGGLAIADIGHTVFYQGLTFNFPNRVHLGWTAGGGIVGRINEIVSAFIEARYTDYESKSFGENTVAGMTLVPHRLEADHVQVQAGISIQLGELFSNGN